METGTGAATETKAVVETGKGTRTGTRTGLGRAVERGRSARNPTRVVDAMWETGETWAEREKKHIQERIDSIATDPDNLENSKEAGREAQGT